MTSNTHSRQWRVSIVIAAIAIVASACSSATGKQTAPAPPTTSARPEGPAAEVTQELTGGQGTFIGEPAGTAIPSGYVQKEYLATGTATDYTAVGPLGADGRWTFQPSTSAPYRTRVLVRRPADPDSFSGTVVVEWLNVSGGVDADPDYSSLSEEIVRQGDIWVGVSAQLIGVEGGPVLVKAPGAGDVLGKGLKAIDPERYGTLTHPGDGYSFDIYTQVARAVREGGPVVGDVTPDHVLAIGESQSAIALTTYYDGVQPLAQVFDGFLAHSRGAGSLPLVGPGKYADIAGSISGSVSPIFRTDLAAPVLELQAESDVVGILNSVKVRQPDSDTFRLWEVAGTSHADAHLMGSNADLLDCGVAINNGPMHIVAKAALRALDTWVSTGQAPPVMPRLELTDPTTTPKISRDTDGIALGGIRTPPVDVPVEVLSGVAGPNPDVLCILLGSTTPMTPARLAALYPSSAAYTSSYAAATDAAIDSGVALAEDRAALLGFARPAKVAN